MKNDKQRIEDIGEGFVEGYRKGYDSGFLHALQGIKNSMIRNNIEIVTIKSIIKAIQFHKAKPLQKTKK